MGQRRHSLMQYFHLQLPVCTGFMVTHHDITYQHHSIQFVLCQVTAVCITGSVGLSKYWKIRFRKSCVHRGYFTSSINFLNTSIVRLVSLALSAASCGLDRYTSYSWWCMLSENDFIYDICNCVRCLSWNVLVLFVLSVLCKRLNFIRILFFVVADFLI